MRHAFAIATFLAVLSGPAALAQTAEPRLAGAPQRVCTDEEIRQAMNGSYAGEPCRFREMPQGQAAPRGGSLPARPQVMPPSARPAVAQNGQPVGYGPAPTIVASGSQRGSSASAYGYYESSGSRDVRQVGATAGIAAPVRHSDPAHHDTVSLGPEFFSGSLVGGVEARLPALYSYRTTILIDAAGGVQVAAPGTSLVHVMDRQARPPQLNSTTVRRVYPAY